MIFRLLLGDCAVQFSIGWNSILMGLYDGLGSRFAMHELGISSKKPFKKCARVVGEVRKALQ